VAAHPPEVRAALDAFRHIVQALRTGGGGGPRSRLSSAQLFALQQIGDHPESSINDIAALTFTHQSSVSVVIQRLVRHGLVTKRSSGDDRRRSRLALTAKGRRALRRAPAAIQGRLIAAISELPVVDRHALARSLSRIARLIAPRGGAANPPMFFEGSATEVGKSGTRRSRRSR
jgi:DNA-binding MarR family transcriptional regulator